jgi:hypothetical protein
MLCLGVFFEGHVILILFFVTNREKNRDVRMEMCAKSIMKRFNLHTPSENEIPTDKSGKMTAGPI